MDQRAHHGIQRPADGQRDGDEVQQHGKGHIALDSDHHAAGQRHQMRQLLDLIVHQRNIRRVYGDIAANAPMAMPTSAFFRAGASFTPSPIMQTGMSFC